ncbi:MAG: hypothetical protein U0984_17740 [Prosthecobacter sp.]|nr:hypothetical protein [Prosthecobacter sp.]
MSGLVGHSMYGLLAAREASKRGLAVASLLTKHEASYLAGAYIGCDIQVMPEAVCVDTGREVGFGTVPLERSPITGGAVQPWSLEFQGQSYRPKQIHQMFYGRAHLVFGWAGDDAKLAVPWDHLDDYCALAIRDHVKANPHAEASIAYLFGWMVHMVGDSLIKSIRPGIRMKLLDGTYTPRNRPIQDLFAYHEIGIKELHLDWPNILHAMAATPVEAAQFHYMRIAKPEGELAKLFSDGWRPEQAGLLAAVLQENRRWLTHHADDVLEDMTLGGTSDAIILSKRVRAAVGDFSYAELMSMAERAQMRDTLKIISESSVDLFEQVLAKIPELR